MPAPSPERHPPPPSPGTPARPAPPDCSPRSPRPPEPPSSRDAAKSAPEPRAKLAQYPHTEIRPPRNPRTAPPSSRQILPRTPPARPSPPPPIVFLPWMSASSALLQNPIHRLAQVLRNAMRLHNPIAGVPSDLAFAISFPPQPPACSSPVRQFDIAITIPHDERSLQINPVLPRRLFQHSRLRLPAIASIRRSMRAKIHRIDSRPRLRKLRVHQRMHLMHQRLRKISPPYSRLICHHDHRDPRFVQSPHRPRNKRKQAKPADVIQIAHFFSDGPI